jgi:hypothetical protein
MPRNGPEQVLNAPRPLAERRPATGPCPLESA